MKLVIVNDDEETLRQLEELAAIDLPTWTVQGFSGIYEAAQQSGIDYLLIDISSVAHLNLWEHSYAPICSFIDMHPGTTIVITSGVSRNAARDVMEQVKEHSGREVTYGGDGMHWKETLAALTKI